MRWSMVALAGAVLLIGSTSAEAQPAPLRITDVFPDGGSVDVPTDTRPSVIFDRRIDVDRAFKTKPFRLKKVGSKNAVPRNLGYCFFDNKLELTPTDPLEPNTIYVATVKGGKKGVRAADGGRLGGVDDPSATFKNGNVSWTFTTAAN